MGVRGTRGHDHPRREGHAAPQAPRQARLFRNGRNQALRIPRDLEFPGDTVILP